MEHQGANLFAQQLVQLVIENKFIAAVVWIIIMALILRKIAKKDNDLYLKESIFKKKNKKWMDRRRGLRSCQIRL